VFCAIKTIQARFDSNRHSNRQSIAQQH